MYWHIYALLDVGYLSCRKHFNQWLCSFQTKLHWHWLRGDSVTSRYQYTPVNELGNQFRPLMCELQNSFHVYETSVHSSLTRSRRHADVYNDLFHAHILQVSGGPPRGWIPDVLNIRSSPPSRFTGGWGKNICILTHWFLDRRADIVQTKFWNSSLWRNAFHFDTLFLGDQLSVSYQWFR